LDCFLHKRKKGFSKIEKWVKTAWNECHQINEYTLIPWFLYARSNTKWPQIIELVSYFEQVRQQLKSWYGISFLRHLHFSFFQIILFIGYQIIFCADVVLISEAWLCRTECFWSNKYRGSCNSMLAEFITWKAAAPCSLSVDKASFTALSLLNALLERLRFHTVRAWWCSLYGIEVLRV
jgi:hypothetical protein